MRAEERCISKWATAGGLLLVALLSVAQTPVGAGTRVIEVLADKDSRYKISGERTPSLQARADEPIVLRITAKKGKTWNRDGSIHGFSLLRVKDRAKVDGWDLLLKPGVQEFQMTAPHEPGDYVVVCTVICSEDHEGMFMKFVVTP